MSLSQWCHEHRRLLALGAGVGLTVGALAYIGYRSRQALSGGKSAPPTAPATTATATNATTTTTATNAKGSAATSSPPSKSTSSGVPATKSPSAPSSTKRSTTAAAAANPTTTTATASTIAPVNHDTSTAQGAKAAGNDAYKAKNYREAIQLYTKAIALQTEPKERAICFGNRAACHLYLNAHNEVIADCTEALALDPLYVKAFHRRGQAHEHLGQVREALHDFTAVCMVKKYEDAEAMQLVERILKSLGEQQALMVLQLRKPKLPGKATIHMYLESYHTVAMETASVEELTSLLAGDQQNGELHLRLALARITKQDYEQVLEAATTAASLLQAKLDSNEECDKGLVQAQMIQALEVQGSFHHLSAMPAQALVCFDKILALNPDHVNALLRRATTLVEQGRGADAMESLQVAIRTAPRDLYARYHYAQTFLLKDDIGKAQEEFQNCVKLEPPFPGPYIQFALCQLKTGSPALALETFKTAMQLFANTPDVYTYFGQMMMELGNVEEAEKHFRIAQTKTTISPLPAFFHAQILLMKKDVEGAVGMLKKAVETDPCFEGAYQALVQISLQQRMLDSALTYIEKVIAYARTADDLVSALACKEAALAQKHVLQMYPPLKSIVDSL